MLHQMDQGSALSPEQIRAYKDMEMDVYGCFKVGGPPPAGNTIWILVPKNSKAAVKFGDDCHIIVS